jgi:signal transduction histidine kinase
MFQRPHPYALLITSWRIAWLGAFRREDFCFFQFRSNSISDINAGVLEYITLFIGYLAVIVTDSEQRRQLSLAANKFRLYLALSFPEVLMKMIAISLQLFDCEPTVLFLLAVLIISIQNFSMGWVTTLSPSKLIVGTMISILLKLGLRMMAYPPSDVWMMGILL